MIGNGGENNNKRQVHNQAPGVWAGAEYVELIDKNRLTGPIAAVFASNAGAPLAATFVAIFR